MHSSSDCHAVTMHLSCDCHAVTMHLSCDCHVIIMHLSCDSYVTVPSRRYCSFSLSWTTTAHMVLMGPLERSGGSMNRETLRLSPPTTWCVRTCSMVVSATTDHHCMLVIKIALEPDEFSFLFPSLFSTPSICLS